MNRLKKYVLLLLHLTIAVTYVKCDGEVSFLGKPDSLRFQGGDQMLSSDVFESLEHLLGFQYPGAKQMEMMNVFDYEKLKILMVLVSDSTPYVDSSNAVKKYQMKEDMPLDDMVAELKKLTPRENSFGKKIDFKSLAEEQNFDPNNDGPQVILADMRSKSQDEVKKTIDGLLNSVKGLPNVLKMIVSSDGKPTLPYERQKRDTPAEDAPADKKEPINAKSLNLADDYDEDFPVIFNIMLWFSLALIFSLISICMVIANMDPGRDSIIYRMTSTRMKKDN